MKGVDAVKLLRTITNPTNMKILGIIRQNGEMYPAEIARVMDKSESIIVRKLKELERIGLLESRWNSSGDRPVKLYSFRDISFYVYFDGELKVESEDRSISKLVELIYERNPNIKTPDDLVRASKSIAAETVSSELGISIDRARELLDDLKKSPERAFRYVFETMSKITRCSVCGKVIPKEKVEDCSVCGLPVCPNCMRTYLNRRMCLSCYQKRLNRFYYKYE